MTETANECRMLSVSSILGYGCPEASLKVGIEHNSHFIGVDGGSTDPGAFYLRSRECLNSRKATKRNQRLMLMARVRKNFPIVIGTCGVAGAGPHLQYVTDLAREITGEENLGFRMTPIHTDQTKSDVRSWLKSDRITALRNVPVLTEATVENTTRTVHLQPLDIGQASADNRRRVFLLSTAPKKAYTFEAHTMRYRLCALSIMAATLAATAHAQNYPNRPIRLIVPSSPGGGQDIVSRAVAIRLTESLGQAVVVDNRGGGGGGVGAELTKHAQPDGYAIGLISSTAIVRPLMYPSDYDATRDYIPITQLTSNPYVLVVHPSIPVKSVQEFVAYAKANPGKLNFASSGPGSQIHLGCELLNSMAGIKTVHLPYKGTGAAYPDLIAGHVHWTLANITSSQPYIRQQRLRGLAVSGAMRALAQPDLPTIAESGVASFEVTQWYGILAPLKTPRSIIDQLTREMVKVVREPEFARRFAADGTETVGSNGPEFLEHLKREQIRWSKVIKEQNIKGG